MSPIWVKAECRRLVLFDLVSDGAPRITHIWPYAGLDARISIRADSYARGIWPPKNAPEQFFEATSMIGLPTGNSLLA